MILYTIVRVHSTYIVPRNNTGNRGIARPLGEHAGQILSSCYPTPLLLIYGSALLRFYHLTRVANLKSYV